MTTISFTLPRLDYAAAQVNGRATSSAQMRAAQEICDLHASRRDGGMKPVFIDFADTFQVVGWARGKGDALAVAKRSGALNEAHKDYVASEVIDGDGEAGFLVDRS